MSPHGMRNGWILTALVAVVVVLSPGLGLLAGPGAAPAGASNPRGMATSAAPSTDGKVASPSPTARADHPSAVAIPPVSPSSWFQGLLAPSAFAARGGAAMAALPSSAVPQSWNQAASTVESAASGVLSSSWTVSSGDGVAFSTALTLQTTALVHPQVGCRLAPVGSPPATFSVPATPSSASPGTANFYEFALNSSGAPNTSLFAIVSDAAATLLFTSTGSACEQSLSFQFGAVVAQPTLDSTTAASIANLAGGSNFLQKYPGAVRYWFPSPSVELVEAGNLTLSPSIWYVEYQSPCNASTAYVGSTFDAMIDGATGAVLSNSTGTSSCLPDTFPVTFTESGLPSGTSWTVDLGGAFNTSTSTSLGFTEGNGTYAYTVLVSSGYAPSPSSGNLTISGTAASVAITFTATPTYSVTLKAIGLASGTYWSVLWNGSLSLETNASSLAILAVDGTYSYSIDQGATNSTGYTISPTTGTVTISGLAATVSITFTVATLYPIKVTETGLPAGMLWGVEFASSSFRIVTSTSSQLSLYVENSTYYLIVGSASPSYYLAVGYAIVPVAGAPASVTFAFHYRTSYVVTFQESGLAASAAWFANVSWTYQNQINSSTGSSVTFLLINGTYNFGAGGAPGYVASPANGTLTVAGGRKTVTIAFAGRAAVATYPVTFSETTLPSGTSWSVTLAGSTQSSTTGSIVFNEPNNTYAFSVGAPSGYAATPSSSSLTVHGVPVTQVIRFEAVYSVTFSETGLASGTSWSVTLNGTTQSSGTTSIVFSEPDGQYGFSVAAVSGYSVSPVVGTVTVSGSAVAEAISFSPLPTGSYPVVLTETGLPVGTNWSVTLHGQSASSTGRSISFVEVNGTYPYVVATVAGYTSTPSSGNVTVNGAAESVAITFAALRTYSVTFVESGLATGTTWSIGFNGGAPQTASAGASIVVSATNGTYPFTVGGVSGYTANVTSGSVHVHGGPQTVTIQYTATSSPANTLLGLPAWEGYSLIGIIAVVVILGIVLAALRRGRRTTGSSPPPSGAPPPGSPPSSPPGSPPASPPPSIQ